MQTGQKETREDGPASITGKGRTRMSARVAMGMYEARNTTVVLTCALREGKGTQSQSQGQGADGRDESSLACECVLRPLMCPALQMCEKRSAFETCARFKGRLAFFPPGS